MLERRQSCGIFLIYTSKTRNNTHLCYMSCTGLLKPQYIDLALWGVEIEEDVKGRLYFVQREVAFF